tara:strand:+ start:1685 stop:2281 length:597 start_codon:yes stop_codon:yes gene_type:complete
MYIRQFFFKNRSYTPIPIVLIIIYYSEQSQPHVLIGVGLIIMGEIIRISAVRYAGGATRTRNVGAPYLCTSGPYSLTRNPLYCGNVIIYTGMVFFAGGAWVWYTLTFVAIFFIIQYYYIISLEEETLKEKFKSQYDIYITNVPKLFPRLSAWKGDSQISPKGLLSTLKTEKRTLQNIFLISSLIIFKEQIVYFLQKVL